MIAFLVPWMMPLAATAQIDTVKIHTSAICETCKATIEHDLSFEKGVKSVNLDVESGDVTVLYHPKKTEPQTIRTALTRIGYDADTLKADPKAWKKLPDCCKHPGAH